MVSMGTLSFPIILDHTGSYCDRLLTLFVDFLEQIYLHLSFLSTIYFQTVSLELKYKNSFIFKNTITIE